LPFPTRQYRLESGMYAANANGPNREGQEEKSSPHGLGLRHALAGLQAGVLGALVIFLCLIVGSLWDGHSIWVVPNLFATTFFGSGVYRNQLLRASWTGLALIVAIYGVLGILWGCIWRDERIPWLGFYGAIAGIGVYFLFFSLLWRHVNPLVTLYAPDRQLQLGHVLWGIILARSPLYARRIADTTVPRGVQSVTEPEVRSGEVIR
jgi:hypothetical protein